MNAEIVVIILLALACLGLLGWALTLRRRPLPERVVIETVPGEPLPAPPPKVITKEIDRVVYVTGALTPEPEDPLGGNEHLAEPQALPDVPDAVHDSVFDGARFGGLVVRLASVRGDLARRDARLRRQTAAISLLGQFDPPVLLATVAAGHALGKRSQVGAAQACRSVPVKLSDRAYGLNAAWKAADAGDPAAHQELTELLREVTLALRDSLALTAKGRNQPDAAVATELTCVLSRIGDMPARPHLAFGIGAAPVLRLSGGVIEEVFRPEAGFLPAQPEAVTWATFTTAPGQTVIACTSGTADYLRREQVREHITARWGEGAPSGVNFLAHLGAGHQAYQDDRTAVAIWNGDR